MALPLELTGREQEFLAQICAALASIHYDRLTNNYVMRAGAAEEVIKLVDDFQQTPQTLGGLYDRLHRTGKNS